MRRTRDAPPDPAARDLTAVPSPSRPAPGPRRRRLITASRTSRSALPLRGGQEIWIDVAAPADHGMHTEPAGRILIDKGLPHFQPVGLAVALRAAHRRPEIFHAEQ